MTYGIPREIVKYLADHHNITTREARKSVAITFDAIAIFLQKGKTIKIKNFGTFDLVKYSERTYHSLHNQGIIKVEPKAFPRFHATKRLKETVKDVGVKRPLRKKALQ